MKPWKLQKFAGDVVYDLRSRGLLPVAVLLIVGILAVPVLVSRGGSEPVPPPAPSETASEIAPETQSAVLAYSPGVRNYKQRLNDSVARDPFIQQFLDSGAAAPAEAAAEGAGSVPDTGGGGGGAPEVTVDEPSGGGDVSTTGGGSGKTTVKTRYYYYETDVLVGEAGTKLQRRNRIDVFSFQPSEAAPVLVYLGVSDGGKRAVFLVAKDVIELTGPGFCFPTPESCQLLALSPEQAQNIVYGPTGKTYRIKLLKIDKVVSAKPPKQ